LRKIHLQKLNENLALYESDSFRSIVSLVLISRFGTPPSPPPPYQLTLSFLTILTKFVTLVKKIKCDEYEYCVQILYKIISECCAREEQEKERRCSA